jgi:hypothetical protein
MTDRTKPNVTISVIAGYLHAQGRPIHPDIGKQVTMGDDFGFMLHITPEVAAQWLPVLTKIANEGKK